MLAVAKEAKDK